MLKDQRLDDAKQAVTPSPGIAIVEVLIGDVVVRAPVDADEAHLQRVIRAVRSA